MEDNKAKGGRPAKRLAEKRKYKITIRVNTLEYYSLRERAKVANVCISEYIRECSLNGYVKERVSLETCSIIRQLSGMANNLNQIAHQANIQGYSSIATLNKERVEQIDFLINRLLL